MYRLARAEPADERERVSFRTRAFTWDMMLSPAISPNEAPGAASERPGAAAENPDAPAGDVDTRRPRVSTRPARETARSRTANAVIEALDVFMIFVIGELTSFLDAREHDRTTILSEKDIATGTYLKGESDSDSFLRASQQQANKAKRGNYPFRREHGKGYAFIFTIHIISYNSSCRNSLCIDSK
jgi:hypothetical protein